MEEKTIVRQNMMDDKNYRPYCGGPLTCSWPRVDKYFKCPECGHQNIYPPEFMERYKKKHGVD